MQSKNFLKKIQQKNINCDIRKLSLQSIQTSTDQPQQKNIFLIQPPSYHTQLPAFINRKVKNLKPYTNHFKRFNIQSQKIAEKGQQGNHNNKIVKTSELLNDRLRADKSSLLKQLGIQQEIKPGQTLQKVAEISVYDQFLQKTSTVFSSNAIQQMYRQSLKKHQRNTKELYQRSNRLANTRDSREKIVIPRQQRRSVGGMDLKNERQQLEGNKISSHGIKSMNQLPKTQQNVLRSDKVVCIIPTLMMNLHNEDMVLKQGLKYMETLKKKKSIAQTAESTRKVTEQNVNDNEDKNALKKQEQEYEQKVQQGLMSVVGGQKDDIVIEEKGKQSPTVEQMQSCPKSNVESKTSPSRQQKGIFNLNIGLKLSSQQKVSNTQFLTKKSQKEVTTINVDKTKKLISPQFLLPNNVTAYSYIVYEPSFSQNSNSKLYQQNLANTNKLFSNNRVLTSLNCKTVVEIASLTKIMTFLLSLQICERLKLQAQNEKVRIGKFQANINGTSAQVKEGEIYTVEQLYYGLMLPSGNDASLALATWGGKKILIHEIKQKEKLKKKFIADISPLKNFIQPQTVDSALKPSHQKIILKKKKCYDRFILQMNKKARSLGMTKTTYANSHGLSNNLNKSCAFDLCILCEYAMNNDKFRKVVSTVEFRSTILYEQLTEESVQKMQKEIQGKQKQQQDRDDIQHENEHSDEESAQSYQEKQQTETLSISQRQKKFSISQTNFVNTKSIDTEKPITYGEKQVFWQNTHKLLSRQQYIGIKTGITNTAGPCLASCIRTKENRCFIIIVLNSKKLNYRFKDTEALRKWVYKREKLMPVKTKKLQVQSSLMNYHDEQMEEPAQNNDDLKEGKKVESQR